MGRKTYEKPLGRTPEMTAGWKGNGRLLDLDVDAFMTNVRVSKPASASSQAPKAAAAAKDEDFFSTFGV